MGEVGMGMAAGELGRETISMDGDRRPQMARAGVPRLLVRERGYPRVRFGVDREGPASLLVVGESVLEGERRVRLIARVAIV